MTPSTPRRALAVALVVSLALLAGCNGVAEGLSDAPDDRDPYTVDDPVEPTATPTVADDADLPPGLSESGIENAGELWSAHRESLDAGTYAVRTDVTVVNGNLTTVGNRTEWFLADLDDDDGMIGARYHVIERFRGDPAAAYPTADRGIAANDTADEVEIEHWIDIPSDETYRRTAPGNGSVTYTDASPTVYLPGDWYLQSVLPAVAAAEDPVERRTYEGEAYYVVSADAPAVGSSFVDDDDFSVTLYVTGDGRIEHYRLEGTTRVDGQPHQVVRTGTVYGVNETDVERPSWYDEAVEATADEDDDAPSNGEANADAADSPATNARAQASGVPLEAAGRS